MANVKRLMFCEFECVFVFLQEFWTSRKKNIHLLSFLKCIETLKSDKILIIFYSCVTLFYPTTLTLLIFDVKIKEWYQTCIEQK